MMSYLLGRLFQVMGLALTAGSLLWFHDRMYPMLQAAAVGAAVFYLGGWILGRNAQGGT